MEADQPCLPARLALRLADFAWPDDVLAAENLDDAEKRQFLAAWAFDAHAPESRPGFRWLPGTPGPVPVRAVLEALARIQPARAPMGVVIAAFNASGKRHPPPSIPKA
jgi:hypothetical protein